MDIRPIRSAEDLKAVLARIDALWGAEIGTPEGDELDVLADLAEHYESRRFFIRPSEPLAVLQYMMEENGKTQKDLAELLGSQPRASEVLSGKRALTTGMISKLAAVWHIPAGALIPVYEAA